ncbi:MAG: hypothetical protein IPK82_25785 [Polyangiaceae bacterium]|nr:hypothetical protein [Polyangiaceae bacterium]
MSRGSAMLVASVAAHAALLMGLVNLSHKPAAEDVSPPVRSFADSVHVRVASFNRMVAAREARAALISAARASRAAGAFRSAPFCSKPIASMPKSLGRT